jgi:4-amino-4-deoxy-L-arabinose transferase-like glycosyltransferase
MKCLQIKNQWLVLLVLLVLYVFSRLLFLDADIPVWSVSHYSPIDELYYTETAFNWVEGVYAPNGQYEVSYFNLAQQLLTSLSLSLFGDNYYGLRLPSVLAGWIVVSSLYLITLKRFGFASALCFSLLLISEVSFLLATRVAEPTIFRLAAISILLLAYSLEAEHKSQRATLFLGVLTGVAWCFIYPTNAFVVLAGFLLVFLSNEKNIKYSLIYCLGILISIIIYAVVLYAFDFDIQKNLSILHLFTARVAGTSQNGFWLMGWGRNLLSIRYANFLVMNPFFSYLLVGFICIFIYFRKQLIQTLKIEDKIILVFLLSFLIQTMFISDYPQRKLLILLPFLLYVSLLIWSLLPHIFPEVVLKKIGMLIFSMLLISFIAVSIFRVFTFPAYQYKKAMSQLGYLDGLYVVGGWGYGFRLYNSYKPYLNKYNMIYRDPSGYYKQLKDAVSYGDSGYVIEYGDEKTSNFLSKIGYEKFRLIFRTNDPVYPDVYLFKYHRIK